MKKLNPQVKTAWLDALRSGDYRQGKHNLRNIDNSYCCLGVLCDIQKVKWKIDPYQDHYRTPNYSSSFIISKDVPEDVLNVLGQKVDDDQPIQLVLAKINDQAKDFEPTIRWIEENL